MSGEAELLVGLDVGASKAAAVIARRAEDGLAVLGSGYAPLVSAGHLTLCDTTRRSAVIDLDATTRAIAEAIREAELTASCSVHSAVVAVGGAHVRGVNSHGVIPVRRGEVTPEDVEQVLEAARSVAFPPDRQVLHVLPYDYVLDQQEGIADPIGMLGARLEARVHVVSASVSAVQNVARCCERAGVEPAELIWAPLATAEAVLTPEEKELGVAFWDFGAGTTDVLIFYRGGLRWSFSLGIGGAWITSDVAHGLQTPLREAEFIKVQHGCALRSMVDDEERVEVPGIGGRSPRFIPRKELAWMIEARADEIVRMLWRGVEEVDADRHVRCGSVIAGSGALLPAMDRLVQEVTGREVRLGATRWRHNGNGEEFQENRASLDPVYATALGLLLLHTREHDRSLDGFPAGRGLWNWTWGRLRAFWRALRE
ncbi:Cell division protein FtsA [bacterium HR30]|nr:Cell division protein FtsA [bacterium HR30]